jgi:hypothetical protein
MDNPCIPEVRTKALGIGSSVAPQGTLKCCFPERSFVAVWDVTLDRVAGFVVWENAARLQKKGSA